MKVRLLLATLLAFTLAIPLASAQDVGIRNPNASTPTVLYFHVNGFQDFAINTQKPEDRYDVTEGVGIGTHSLGCLPDPPGSNTFVNWHTYYGYSSPGYVEYNFEENGRPRTHPERGISYDATIDQGAPFFLYWYLQSSPNAGTAQGGLNPEMVPMPLPNVRLSAVMRAADTISVNDAAYNNAPELARGTTEPVTLVADQVLTSAGPTTSHPHVRAMQHNGGYLYEFKVPMTATSPVIPRATGYNIRIDATMDNQGVCPQAGDPNDPNYFMPNFVKLHTSAQFRPRMELAITNPIRLEYLHPQFVGDDLVIHTSMNAAWGNYDVNEQDPDGITVTVTGPSPATSLAKAAIVQRTHEHYHHQEAVDITYVWPYKTDRAQNGLYTVQVTAMNDQRTATASGTAQFEIGKGTVIGCGGVQESAEAISDDCARDVQADGVATKDSPGLGLVLLLGVLGAALVVLRRRS